MRPSNTELQRLLHLLVDTASKAEHDAYNAGWRDCHAAMVKAMSGLTESLAAVPAADQTHEQSHQQPYQQQAPEPAPVFAPVETQNWDNPAPYMNGTSDNAFAN
jgi:hypothetical protein